MLQCQACMCIVKNVVKTLKTPDIAWPNGYKSKLTIVVI